MPQFALPADRIEGNSDTAHTASQLIASDEGPTVEVVNPDGPGDIVLICEHASNRIPRALNGLGLDDEALDSHVAWDPGAAAVSGLLAAALDAPLVLQRFSRLVYDCNRPPDAESAMPARSEIYEIPGNVDLTEAERRARIKSIYEPFRESVASVLDRKMRSSPQLAVVTVHSFTPIYHGVRRSVELGLLHDEDSRLTDAMLDLATGWSDLEIQRNQPYGPKDGVTHTLKIDAMARGLANVMIEIRNDLIATPAGQDVMARRLTELIGDALKRLTPVATARGLRATG